MPPKTTPPSLPFHAPPPQTIPIADAIAARHSPAPPLDDRTQRTADHRDQTPTQGPGSAAGLFGDHATRQAFVDGAPIHDGKAITPPQTENPPQHDDHPNAPAPPSDPAPPADPPRQPDPPPSTALARPRDPLPFYPTNTDEMWRYATMLAGSGLLPRALKDKDTGRGIVASIHLVLMKGHDFGLKPMQSLASINVIDGKAEIGALMMLSLVRKSGLCQIWKLVESTERRCIFLTRRIGDTDDTIFEYTIEEAEQMGLLDKGKSDWAKENNQWRRQPRTMLRRRCQSMLLREVYSDVVAGMYDDDELAELREINGVMIDGAPVAAAVTQRSLGEAGPAGPIERMTQAAKPADPLKARLEAKRSGGGLVARCSQCETVLDPRDTDPCIACRPEPA